MGGTNPNRPLNSLSNNNIFEMQLPTSKRTVVDNEVEFRLSKHALATRFTCKGRSPRFYFEDGAYPKQLDEQYSLRRKLAFNNATLKVTQKLEQRCFKMARQYSCACFSPKSKTFFPFDSLDGPRL
nr:hypothetical protein CFP56_25694 [Quercus suber]